MTTEAEIGDIWLQAMGCGQNRRPADLPWSLCRECGPADMLTSTQGNRGRLAFKTVREQISFVLSTVFWVICYNSNRKLIQMSIF